jgi:hypothetical protein
LLTLIDSLGALESVPEGLEPAGNSLDGRKSDPAIMDTNSSEAVPVMKGPVIKSQRCKYGIGQHPGYKNPSEDRVVVLDLNDTMTLYMVLDGHGGSHYAEETSKILPNRIKERINNLSVSSPSGKLLSPYLSYAG